MVLDLTTNSSSTVFSPPTVLEQLVLPVSLPSSNGEPCEEQSAPPSEELSLLFLGCEANPPYGPYIHTATLFLELIRKALEKCSKNPMLVRLTVFPASEGHLPESADPYDGVILPGSFNSAYDQDNWVLRLSKFIQEELVAKAKPTMGVCFGHQIYAHSFGGNGKSVDGGVCVKCPAGKQIGPCTFPTTAVGQTVFQQSSLSLYYTHGDMVESLPYIGLSLGGNDVVPIQSAMYFASPEQAAAAAAAAASDGDVSSFLSSSLSPMAITFQAHPEYATSRELGVDKTLMKIMDHMMDLGLVTTEHRDVARKKAYEEYDRIEQQSSQVMITVGRLLGWFPKE